MNYHSDEWIIEGLQRHYEEALKLYTPRQIVGVFYTGSAELNADDEKSDIDSWVFVIEENYNEDNYEIPVAYLGKEVIRYSDIRAYVNGIYHSDWVYLLLLFGNYHIINPLYEDLISQIFINKEKFAYNNVLNNTKQAKYWLNRYTQDFLTRNPVRSYGKTLYYCFLIFIAISVYQHNENYSSFFHNDLYGEELKRIKRDKYSYMQCRKMLKSIVKKIESFHPTFDEYPPIEGLTDFCKDIKQQFLARYKNNEHSNQN